jgi:hypothetical protein
VQIYSLLQIQQVHECILPTLTYGWHLPTDARTHASHEQLKNLEKEVQNNQLLITHIGIDHFAAKHGQIEGENFNLPVHVSHSTGYIHCME